MQIDSEQTEPNRPKHELVTPKIYVADLSAYTSGLLRGIWIDANQDAEYILSDIEEMLSGSPEPVAEEWFITDFEGFGRFHLAEHDDLPSVSALAGLINEFGEIIASEIWGHVGCDADDAKTMLTENYLGRFESLEDWAWDYLESSGELDKIPEHLRSYFDTKSYARDLELNGDVFTVEDGCEVHLFWGR